MREPAGSPQPDVLIVGGGVVGLSTAYFLSESRDVNVTVLERGAFGRAASWAAAGMLAVQCEIEEPGPFLTLGLSGRALYKRLAPRLADETGVDIGYRPCGILRVAQSAEEREDLIALAKKQESLGLGAEWLEPAEVLRRAPKLASATTGGVFLPEDGQVDNRRLVEALVQGCARRGVRLLEQTEVTDWIADPPGDARGRKVRGVTTASGAIHAGAVVLAGGAWSKQLAGRLGISLPVFPVKGEILALRLHEPSFDHIVFSKGTCYLVPRADGRLLVGATEEKGAFRSAPTLGGAAALTERALRLAPGLGEAEVIDHWGGLRPGTPDGAPILGPVPEWEGLYVATGHYRNGILLGPISGMTIASLIMKEPAPINWRPFSLSRFEHPVDSWNQSEEEPSIKEVVSL